MSAHLRVAFMKTAQDVMHALAIVAFLDGFRHLVQFIQVQKVPRIELVRTGNQRVVGADGDACRHGLPRPLRRPPPPPPRPRPPAAWAAGRGAGGGGGAGGAGGGGGGGGGWEEKKRA